MMYLDLESAIGINGGSMAADSPKRRLTIAEVAQAAGVSVPTVSKVLNNRQDVAAATRDRVLRVINEQGYVRSPAARALSRARTGFIDLVVTTLDTPYMLEIIRGVEEALEPTEFRLALSATHGKVRGERQWLTKVANGSTDGAILLLSQSQMQQLEVLRRRNIPFIVIDHIAHLGTEVPSVSATNWAGGRVATEYLLSLGHRRIAMITGPASYGASKARLAGYRTALDEAGVPLAAELVRQGDFRAESGYTQTAALLQLAEPPTAIFSGNDLQAMGAYSALQQYGIALPGGMSVIGFDDLPLSALLSPPLTTIRQPLEEMGHMATTMLLRLIACEGLDTQRVELATSLIVRASCGMPPVRDCSSARVGMSTMPADGPSPSPVSTQG
jgi:LacI family transcriptional regulator